MQAQYLNRRTARNSLARISILAFDVSSGLPGFDAPSISADARKHEVSGGMRETCQEGTSSTGEEGEARAGCTNEEESMNGKLSSVSCVISPKHHHSHQHHHQYQRKVQMKRNLAIATMSVTPKSRQGYSDRSPTVSSCCYSSSSPHRSSSGESNPAWRHPAELSAAASLANMAVSSNQNESISVSHYPVVETTAAVAPPTEMSWNETNYGAPSVDNHTIPLYQRIFNNKYVFASVIPIFERGYADRFPAAAASQLASPSWLVFLSGENSGNQSSNRKSETLWQPPEILSKTHTLRWPMGNCMNS